MASKIRIHAVLPAGAPPGGYKYTQYYYTIESLRSVQPYVEKKKRAGQSSNVAGGTGSRDAQQREEDRQGPHQEDPKIPGVVDVDVHETGHVAIISTADATTLKEKLEETLRRPVVVLADHRATHAPPHAYGYGTMPPLPPGAAYRRTPFGGIPSHDEPVRQRAVVFGVSMGVHCPSSEKKAKEDLMKIPGVVEVCASLVMGHVRIIGMADAATLKARLESRLNRPAVLIADFGAVPAPLMGGRYAMVPPPSSAFPAPMATMGVGHHPYGHYNPYFGYYQPPVADYDYTTFGRCFEDEHHNGCCCSIQ